MTLPTYLSVVEREIERLTEVGPYSNAVLKYLALLAAGATAREAMRLGEEYVRSPIPPLPALSPQPSLSNLP